MKTMKAYLNSLMIFFVLIFTGCAKSISSIKFTEEELKTANIEQVLIKLGFKQTGESEYSKEYYKHKACRKAEKITKERLKSFFKAKGIEIHYSDLYPYLKTPGIYGIYYNNFAVIEKGDRIYFNIKITNIKNGCMTVVSILSPEESNDLIKKVIAGYEKEKKKILDRKIKKLKQELLKQQKIARLRLRKGQHVMTFYNKTHYKPNFFMDANICASLCKDKMLEKNGYTSLQEALNDNWQFVSIIGKSEDKISNSCSCIGEKMILKK